MIPSKNRQEIVERNENLLSPGFRSVAAMAGWDEEALLIASLIVEDTPDRNFKQKKRSVFNTLKTPPTNSRRLNSVIVFFRLNICFILFLGCVCIARKILFEAYIFFNVLFCGLRVF